ncbi:uncharacterized protein LOC134958796 [Pseudophryne corroboree]|uniref:uncharacterized protein LOC134958796 n=1 Tax=Pseudophryne corroboree TaxID=495146 RepID=UPI0030820D77
MIFVVLSETTNPEESPSEYGSDNVQPNLETIPEASYREKKCLWRVKYNNIMKNAAIEELVAISKPHYSCADADWVQKKIHHFRTIFLKENKRSATPELPVDLPTETSLSGHQLECDGASVVQLLPPKMKNVVAQRSDKYQMSHEVLVRHFVLSYGTRHERGDPNDVNSASHAIDVLLRSFQVSAKRYKCEVMSGTHCTRSKSIGYHHWDQGDLVIT